MIELETSCVQCIVFARYLVEYFEISLENQKNCLPNIWLLLEKNIALSFIISFHIRLSIAFILKLFIIEHLKISNTIIASQDGGTQHAAEWEGSRIRKPQQG